MDVTLALVVLALGFGGFVKGVVGIGLPLVATPIVANLTDPRTAVVVLAVPIGVTNLWVVFGAGMKWAEFRRVAGVLCGVILGTYGGANLLAVLDVRKLSLYVGVIVVVFVSLQVFRIHLAIGPRLERFVGLPFGVGAGVLGGSTSVFGPLLAMYLYGIGLTKMAFVVTISLLFVVGNVGQILGFSYLGLYTGQIVIYSVAFTLPALLGLWLGMRLQGRIDARLFNRAVLVVMLASALSLIWRGLQP